MPNNSIATIATMGIDIGKNSFTSSASIDAVAIVLRQKWSRGQVEARLAAMTPCPDRDGGLCRPHHLSRKLQAQVTMREQDIEAWQSLPARPVRVGGL